MLLQNWFRFSCSWSTESWLQFSLGGAQWNKHSCLLTYPINFISDDQFLQSQDFSRQATRGGAEGWMSREKTSHPQHDWAFLWRRLALSSCGGHCIRVFLAAWLPGNWLVIKLLWWKDQTIGTHSPRTATSLQQSDSQPTMGLHVSTQGDKEVWWCGFCSTFPGSITVGGKW